MVETRGNDMVTATLEIMEGLLGVDGIGICLCVDN